ncbi:hypothetical protein VKT23_001246 [Stygiomarasmius scandens]|uniref:F-box domain-containing protein n=1 Tax=Marasmiellus scandens TaxID=2682957 RepID=A0ABR1K6I2_9AGAR
MPPTLRSSARLALKNVANVAHTRTRGLPSGRKGELVTSSRKGAKSKSHALEPKPLSIAQRLPFDVLSEIFEICVLHNPYKRETDRRQKGRPYCIIQNAPWVFTYVCAHWREAATSCHALWRHVRIDANNLLDLVSPGRASLLQLYIGRSGNLRLDVILYCRIIDVDDKFNNNTLLPILLQHSDRFQFLSLRTWPHCLPYFSLLLKGRLSSLKILRLYMICSPKENMENSPRSIVDMFAVAPLLENASIRISANRQRFTFRVHSLRQLSVPVSAVPDFQLLTTVEECNLYVNQLARQLVGNNFTSHSLRSLSLKEPFLIRPTGASQVLRSLDLPKLDSLSIQACKKAEVGPSVINLLERSKCKLTNLTLEICDLKNHELQRIFILCPGLVRLRVTSPLGRPLIRRLRNDLPDVSPLLSRLEVFDMYSSRKKMAGSFLTEPFLVLCKAIQTRGYQDNAALQEMPSVKLRELHMQNEFRVGKANAKVKKTMMNLVEKGLKVFVRERLLSLEDLKADNPAIDRHEDNDGDESEWEGVQ